MLGTFKYFISACFVIEFRSRIERRCIRLPALVVYSVVLLAAGCASVVSEPGFEIGTESSSEIDSVPRYLPAVFIDRDPRSACSAVNQDPLAQSERGHTCLEILFATNRALSKKGATALAGEGPKPEDPDAFFADSRFDESVRFSSSLHFTPVQSDRVGVRPYESYRAGRVFVTVPKRAPGDDIEAFDSENLWRRLPWTSRSPSNADRERYFTTWNYELMSQYQFWTQAELLLNFGAEQGRQEWASDSRAALVFVHGFNVGFASAAYRTAQIVYDLEFAGAPFFFSWPANSHNDPLRYFNDVSEAAGATGDLKLFLLDIEEKLKPSKFVLIAHSHGNQLLLRTLDEIAAERQTDDPMFDAIVFASPDVDAFEFRRLVERSSSLARSKTLYTSSDDKANLARQILTGLRTNLFQKIEVKPRAGYVDKSEGPVIANGLHSVDLTGADMGRLGPVKKTQRSREDRSRDPILHDQYLRASDIIADIRSMISRPVSDRGKAVAPHCRTPTLALTSIGASGSFWRFDPHAAQQHRLCPQN